MKDIYAMKVTEKLPFDAYYEDPRFREKIPSRGLMEGRGDNRYQKGKLRAEAHIQPYHRKKDEIKRDLKGAFILISDYFFYFGRNAENLQDQFNKLIKKGPGHKCRFATEDIAVFTGWLTDNFVPGIHGLPCRFDSQALAIINISSRLE